MDSQWFNRDLALHRLLKFISSLHSNARSEQLRSTDASLRLSLLPWIITTHMRRTSVYLTETPAIFQLANPPILALCLQATVIINAHGLSHQRRTMKRLGETTNNVRNAEHILSLSFVQTMTTCVIDERGLVCDNSKTKPCLLSETRTQQ